MNNDFSRMAAILNRKSADYVPLYEHFSDREIIEAVMGQKRAESPQEDLKLQIAFYQQMGFDYVPLEFGPNFAPRGTLLLEDTAELTRGERGWVDEQAGPIRGWEDLENPAYWPEDIFDYDAFDRMAALLPPGMKIIGGAAGGPFEHASFLMGLTPLCFAIADDPTFVAAFFEKLGRTLVTIAERLSQHPAIGAYRFGDDLGYKTATMLSPEVLRTYVFPWYKKIVEAAHRNGKPFVLHSCGQLQEVMDDIIEAGVDAKHSFEDVIMPVTEAKSRWGDRIAILGGIDLDFLCRGTPEQIIERTQRTLDICAPGGGYAMGTGNTVANYIPVENYLAMLKGWRLWNGL